MKGPVKVRLSLHDRVMLHFVAYCGFFYHRAQFTTNITHQSLETADGTTQAELRNMGCSWHGQSLQEQPKF